MSPLVTVICLCYNQARFVSEALQSAVNQTYAHIELIVVDDHSIDDSVAHIQTFVAAHNQVRFIALPQNMGNCKAFNMALKLAQGKYVVDLAADDVLLPDKIAKQVAAFEQLDETYGAGYSDAEMMDENSRVLFPVYKRNANGQLLQPVPQGDIYKRLFEGHFIISPTVMFRKSVLDALGGYDESLSYEDFDIWMRIARQYKFFYLDEVLMRKRRVKGSLSTQFYKARNNQLLASTHQICVKALKLNRNLDEHKALAQFVSYHLRQAFWTENFELVQAYASILKQTGFRSIRARIFIWAAKLRPSIYWLYQMYLKIRH